MGTLRNSIHAPVQGEVTAAQDYAATKKLAEKRKILESYREWNALRSSREGEILRDVVEPILENLRLRLEDGVLSAPRLSLGKIREVRAETRGEIRVWKTIAFNFRAIENLRREIAELHKDAKGETRGKEEKAGVHPAIAKHL